jgi:choline dehydrogenase-like flavoprotein
MILDLDAPSTPGAMDADLCLVGAGAVGITIALAFAGSRHRVIVLEGGGERREPSSDGLLASDLRGLPCSTALDGRARVLGGSTTMWAGQALAFDDDVFARRDWVPDSGWPLGPADVRRHLRRAERVLGLPEPVLDDRGWPPRLPKPPAVEGLDATFSAFSPAPDFARTHRTRLAAAPNVRIVLHANATRVLTARDGSAVEAIEARSLGGRRVQVRARRYVVCCGGIETPRLLLASAVGNARDLVGRCFQEHAHLRIALAARSRRELAERFSSRRVKGIRLYAKLAASERLQRAERILNVGGDVMYDVDANEAVASGRRLVGALRERRPRSAAGHARTVLAHPLQLGRSAAGVAMLGRKASEGYGPPKFCVQVENAPRRESRILLGDRPDALGMPRAVIDWKIDEAELRTIDVFARRVDAGLRAEGLGRLELSDLPLDGDPAALAERLDGGCHHMGATRMADDPADGVVDRDLRVHGMENLYLASSSVFPTGGWGNPTLTLLALALRLADRLELELA